MKWIGIGLALIIAVAIGAWWYEQYKADSTLLQQPVYRVLKQHERTLYDELLEEYRVYQRGEEGPEKFINLANSQISLAATQRLVHASGESVLALMKDMHGEEARRQAGRCVLPLLVPAGARTTGHREVH